MPNTLSLDQRAAFFAVVVKGQPIPTDVAMRLAAAGQDVGALETRLMDQRI
jgi:hypothetical protein